MRFSPSFDNVQQARICEGVPPDARNVSAMPPAGGVDANLGAAIAEQAVKEVDLDATLPGVHLSLAVCGAQTLKHIFDECIRLALEAERRRPQLLRRGRWSKRFLRQVVDEGLLDQRRDCVALEDAVVVALGMVYLLSHKNVKA